MDDFDRQFRNAVIIGCLIFIGLMVVFFQAVKYDGKVLAEMKAACEAKGGELLDHTTRVGKNNHHEYVCVNKNTIIEY